MIRKFFEKFLPKKIVISIEQPKYDITYMFYNQQQTKNTYSFLCDRYLKYLKSWEYEASKVVKKLIEDYVIVCEELNDY
jgi:hypothetical protein